MLVDFDPQGALSVGLGVDAHDLDLSVKLVMERGIRADEILQKTPVRGMDLLPSNIDLSAAEIQLVSEVAASTRCPGRCTRSWSTRPSSRRLPTVAGHADCQCAHRVGLVIVPLECEYSRCVALRCSRRRSKDPRPTQPPTGDRGLLATMYDSRTVHGREVLARLVEAFGDKSSILWSRAPPVPGDDSAECRSPASRRSRRDRSLTVSGREVLARWQAVPSRR